MNILHLDSSILAAQSSSRALTAEIVARLQTLNPGSTVVYHDLVAQPLGHASGAYIGAARGMFPAPAELAGELAAGDALIAELFAADAIVIGAPMYNFSVPSHLKTWIDRVCIGGKTFKYGPKGPEGQLTGDKRVYIASTRGGPYAPPSPMAFMDHQESYMQAVLGFIGLKNVTIIRAEGLGMGDEAKAAAMAKAREQIAAIAA